MMFPVRLRAHLSPDRGDSLGDKGGAGLPAAPLKRAGFPKHGVSRLFHKPREHAERVSPAARHHPPGARAVGCTDENMKLTLLAAL